MSANENVVGMRGYLPPLPVGEPDPEMVERLEELLHEAKHGRLVGFAYASIMNDGTAIPMRRREFLVRQGEALTQWHLEAAVSSLFRLTGRIIDDE